MGRILHPAIDTLAFGVVLLASLYLIILSIVALIVPARAERFLLGFAGSVAKHYSEQLLRLLVGAALVIRAPGMLFPAAFNLFGWVLLITSTILLLLPWRWHQRFAQRVVPPLMRHVRLVGLFSAVLGVFLLAALLLDHSRL